MEVLSNVDSLQPFAPELILGAGVLVVLIVDMFQRGSSRAVAGGLTVATLVLSTVALFGTGADDPQGLFGGLLARDGFSDFFKLLFVLTTLAAGVMAQRSRETIDYRDKDRNAGEFYALALAVCMGMFVMAGATDLLTAYLSLEMVSILSFAMAGWRHRSLQSSEAALKYAIYGGVASGVMLYGMSLLYGLAGGTSLEVLRAADLASSPATLTVGVTLTLAGFGYKIAVVPFHQWCPDVYQGAPTPVTAFLSVGPKAAGFALLARFFFGIVPDEVFTEPGQIFGVQPWPMLLGAVAVATMTLGNLTALVQTNIKRLLAYSSIAHAGYVMLGMLVFGEYAAEGRSAMMFYLFTYLFMNIGAFAVVAALLEKKFGEDLRDYHRLGYRAPLVAGCMAIFLVSLTGLPPTAGFAGKFLLFAAVLDAAPEGGNLLYMIAIIGVVNSAISLFYYAKILRAMYFGHPDVPAERPDDPVAIPSVYQTLLIVCAVPTLVLGVYWSPLLDWARDSLVLWIP